MYYLILTIFLQTCPTCEVSSFVYEAYESKDEFSCKLVGRNLMKDFEIDEYGVRQYAVAKCVYRSID